MPNVRRILPEKRSAKPTPARVAAAAHRMRRAYGKARNDSRLVLGSDSAAWDALGARVDAVANAARVDGLTPAMPLLVSSVMLSLANVPRYAERVHELATWLLAVTQSIEAEDSRAAALAVHLGAIVAECELIVAAADDNNLRTTEAA